MKTESTTPPDSSTRPLFWLGFFGPGAVIASLTVGAGELIFSSRAGALFSYRLLWFFLLILILKWIMAYATARHMVLTGAHPFQRWMDLPGPRGWLPMTFLLLAAISFPIWVSFHAGTLGTLLSWLFGTEKIWRGSAYFLWALGILMVVWWISRGSSYQLLERLQLLIILLMLLSVVICLFLLKPDWLEMLRGFFSPTLPAYPDWAASVKELKGRSVWVEVITYVGVLGGSGYDYLAYVSYLRAKGWGEAGKSLASPGLLKEMAANRQHPTRRWLRAVQVDLALSFFAVLIFATVFVACGALILQPRHEIPAGTNLLALQSQFVAAHAWLQPLYFVGAFLTIFGTLYGTLEVAPAILSELAESWRPGMRVTHAAPIRRWSLNWAGWGGMVVLLCSFLTFLGSGAASPTTLIVMLTPVNLFTGVLACGMICFLSFWSDGKNLPKPLRLSWAGVALNLVAGAVFLFLGLKGYWDQSGWMAPLILLGTLGAGILAAKVLQGRQGSAGAACPP